jgi:hypothetical protein
MQISPIEFLIKLFSKKFAGLGSAQGLHQNAHKPKTEN